MSFTDGWIERAAARLVEQGRHRRATDQTSASIRFNKQSTTFSQQRAVIKRCLRDRVGTERAFL